jgi:hypothetical protein
VVVNCTLIELRARLGSPARFQIDAEPSRRKRPVVTTVRWTCGCSAVGAGLKALALSTCAAHATESSETNGLRIPRLASLLSRP